MSLTPLQQRQEQQQKSLGWNDESPFTLSKKPALTLGNDNNSGLSLSFGSNKSSLAVVESSNKLSAHLISDSFENGAMSVREDREMLSKIKLVLDQTTTQIVATRKKIDGAIDTFYDKSTLFNEECAAYSLMIAKKLTGSQIVTPEEASNCTFIIRLAKEVGTRYFETASQLMDLQKLNNEGKLGDYKGVIDLVFYSRIKEIEILGKRLDLIKSKQEHDVKIMSAIENEKLKWEAAQFDRLLKSAEFNSKEDQRSVENNLKAREEKHKEEIDFQEMVIKEFKINEESKLQELKLKSEADIAKQKLESEKEIEVMRIRAEQRVQILKTAVSVVKPITKCIVM